MYKLLKMMSHQESKPSLIIDYIKFIDELIASKKIIYTMTMTILASYFFMICSKSIILIEVAGKCKVKGLIQVCTILGQGK